MQQTIKFGTDGWRAIIAKEYTVDNVARVASGLASWLLQVDARPRVLIGYDCRFGGALFSEITAKVLCSRGIQVLLAKGFVSTPMVSMGVKTLGAQQGVVITASHNPASYNGFKLKGPHGGPTAPKGIQEVEALIPEGKVIIPETELAELEHSGVLEWVDLESMYMNYLREKFDFSALNKAPAKLAYDAMFGAGQRVLPALLPSAVTLHCEWNPGFNDTPPEPIHKNLHRLSELVASTPELKIGLATDGDADRIGLYDEDGQFVDAHHIILLLIHYLHKYKKLTGKVVVAFSVTNRVKTLCDLYGLPLEITPVGFKYISEKMVQEDVLLGGEESGGIAVKGHIPERDGLYDGLIIYEYMMETGKTLKDLCQEMYALVGTFCYERKDMHVKEAQKKQIMASAAAGAYSRFGKYEVMATEDLDGIKFLLTNGGWVMLRASGTEPVLRVYVEGNTADETQDILKAVLETIL